MFEDVPTEDLLRQFSTVVHDFDDDWGASRIDIIRACDRLIRAAQAIQLEQMIALRDDRGGRDADLSVIGEVALARNISPGAAGTQFGIASAVATLPSVGAALRDGLISEPTVRAICREVTPLHLDDRIIFDGEIAEHLDGLTPGRAARLAREIVVSLDADAASERAEANRADQRVTLLPEEDGVAILMVRGPAEQMVAAHQALESWARGLRATGDPRTTGQIMCATLVERVTGLAHADQVDVEVGIVIDLPTLLAGAGNPVELEGYGPIAPTVAEDMLTRAHRSFYRRLVTDPLDHTLIARDPRRRRFDGPLAGFVRARDRHRCRQPGCDCTIRDIDHIREWSRGGPTTPGNGQGLCKRSHTFKGLPGWSVTTQTDGTIRWRTPTGHPYTSPPPTHPRLQTASRVRTAAKPPLRSWSAARA